MRYYLHHLLISPCLLSLSLAQAELRSESRLLADTLPDFSYAGYACGEKAPPTISPKKYRYFNLEDFGAIPSDNKSDRAAFIAALAAMKKAGGGVLYCPEGVFELSGDAPASESIIINFSPFILKGADRDKSIISMSQPQLPTDPAKMWTSPPLIQIKAPHTPARETAITSDAELGSRFIMLESSQHVKSGDWVKLTLQSRDTQLMRQELGVHYDEVMQSNWEIAKKGIHIEAIHQVKDVSGARVELSTPLLYPINSKLNWKLSLHPHLEDIGVEDLSFRGDCLPDFKHHRSWNDDGGFKPLVINHAVSSWVRRVNFEHVSEALTFNQCAHVSAYDILIHGKRGHSAVRAQSGSTRVLIAQVIDRSDSHQQKGAGQWHAVGVSSRAIGTVLWRNTWGLDSGFESHASQPRITLFDSCEGGMQSGHQGGAKVKLPNHMKDLIFWNFKATSVPAKKQWVWWEEGDQWSKFITALVVGFHGEALRFSGCLEVPIPSQSLLIQPESLYESQVIERQGKLPAWLRKLK